MLKKLNKSNQGFTIVEVVIVLAIAGLIMLIVFLAVPALQRSQRNTSRKNDAGRIGAVATEWVANHGGAAPTAAQAGAFRNAVGTLSYGGYVNQPTVVAGTQGALNNAAQIRLVTGATCNTADGTTTASANSRALAVQWGNETGNGAAQGVCVGV